MPGDDNKALIRRFYQEIDEGNLDGSPTARGRSPKTIKKTQNVCPQLPGQAPDSTAMTARSAQSSRGLGLVRRSSATSCRTPEAPRPWTLTTAAEQDQPAAEPDEHQVEQTEGHG